MNITGSNDPAFFHGTANLVERLNKINEAKGLKDKAEVLRQVDGVDVREFFQLALNPYTTYGIKIDKLPEPVADPAYVFSERTRNLLRALAARTLTGDAAKSAVLHELAHMQDDDRQVLKLVLDRDSGCGLGVKTINRVIKDLIPTFDVQLAHPYDPFRVRQWPVYMQTKLDGVRVLAHVRVADDGQKQVTFLSRSGLEFYAYDELKPHVLDACAQQLYRGWKSFYLDGEVTSGKNFNSTVSAARKKKESDKEAVFHVFDLLTYDEMRGGSSLDGYERRIANRLDFLVENSRVLRVDCHLAYSDEEVMAFYNACRAAGQEGVIVKDPAARYFCTRNYGWMKIKDCLDADVRVVGTTIGTGKYAGKIGALTVDFEGVEVNVGSGLTDEIRSTLPEDLVGRLVEVQYHEKTPDGSMRHPRFIRFRDTMTGEHE